MTAPDRVGQRVVLVDARRTFADGRSCAVARSAAEAIDLLRRHEFHVIDQLWLTDDSGRRPDDGSLAELVVGELTEQACTGSPYLIGEIRIYGQDARGAVGIKSRLTAAGYRVVRDYDLRALSAPADLPALVEHAVILRRRDGARLERTSSPGVIHAVSPEGCLRPRAEVQSSSWSAECRS